jgi:tripeptidyl-peptidase-1
VKAYVAPKSSTLSAFHSFAKANGLSVSNLSDTSEWMELTTTVEHVNSLFGANYQTYSHSSTGALLTRTLAYSLPKELVGHVDMITPSTGFEMQARSHNLGPHVKRTAPHCDTSAPHGYITPKCLQVGLCAERALDHVANVMQGMYGIPAQSAKVKNNTLLVPAYGDLFAQRADLSAFLKLERPDMNPNTTYTFVSLDNGTDPQSPANAG